MLSPPMGRSSLTKKRPASRASRSGRGLLDNETRMSEILRDFASVLVANGYGISRLNRLIRRAYFEAARNLEIGPKASNARIAAVTGLTRTEVTRLARTSSRPSATEEPINRAQRVTIGWTTDRQFCTAAGVPRILSFSGSRGSFSRLVKDYSGDIPARAMLFEMQRLGMVRQDSRGKVRLVRADTPFSRHSIATLGAIIPWVRFLASGSRNCDLVANTSEVELAYSSLPQAYAALKELERRTSAFLRSVRELGNSQNSTRKHSMKIAIALGAHPPRARQNKKLVT
jgi:hypothetical protein